MVDFLQDLELCHLNETCKTGQLNKSYCCTHRQSRENVCFPQHGGFLCATSRGDAW